jgi:hypothetical protein
MEAADYRMAWIIYVLAGTVLSFLCWRVLYKYVVRELAYVLECFLLALLFTPWFVLPEEQIMAPALIVFVMDAITIGPTEAIRALIPLVLALMVAILVSLALILNYRFQKRRHPVRQPSSNSTANR